MFTFETTDQKEVRRFRIAQFNGRTATVRSGGSTVTGHVRSVLESKSSIPQRWTITIVPSEPKVKADACGPRRVFAPSWKTSTERRVARHRRRYVSIDGTAKNASAPSPAKRPDQRWRSYRRAD